MNPSCVRRSLAQTLTRIDKARLESFAPLFDIDFLPQPDDTVLLRLHPVVGDSPPVEHRLPCERAHVRLLAELCSRTVRWVYFHPGESVVCSFLGQPDAKVRRISELYARWKSEGASS